MPTRWIPYVKVLVHLLCLLPLFKLIAQFQSGALGLMADPVQWITHFTGWWGLTFLLISLAITPVRRLHPRVSNLIRFRRMLGLYAFFYATLHLATYAFLFSGYDVPGVYAAVRAGHPGATVEAWKAVWPTVRDDLQKRRFVQVGFAAWVILLALALTSPAWVMRRMGGKPWQTLHRMVYFAAVLGVVHYWWLVKTGVLAPLPMTLILALLLSARFVWSLTHRRRTAAPKTPAVEAAMRS
jgi:sulfoxide reductase heme-binding subunit YedZ